MPELPEVETVCEGLRQTILNDRITKVQLNRSGLRTPFPKDLIKRTTDRTIVRVSRRAKYILIHFETADLMAIHLGMSGSLRIVTPKDYLALKHDHMLIETANGKHAALNDPRRFGMVMMMKDADIETHKAFVHLGPEPLGNQFSSQYLIDVLKSRKAPIKTAIMDQTIVVGVGNIYASESLFRAGIHPVKPACDLTVKEAENLVQSIRDVLMDAIEAGGSTLRDYKKTDGELGYFQHRFSVYGKEGEPCANCSCNLGKTKGIAKLTQGGRSTFFCPVKQV